MFRCLVVPVLMAVVLVPDWATAIGRRNPVFARRAQPISTSYPVQYSQPVYYSAPPVRYAVPSNSCCPPSCQPSVATVPVQPTVVPERMEPILPVKPKTQTQPSRWLNQKRSNPIRASNRPLEPRLCRR